MSMILDGTDEGNTAPTQEPPAWTVRDCAGHPVDEAFDSGWFTLTAAAAHVYGCTCARPVGAS